MPLFRRDRDLEERRIREAIRRRRRPLSSRIAWFLLATGTVVILARASVATIVQIHGDGMAPTIVDGDHVMMVRGAWGLEPGDLVIYAPPAPPAVSDAYVVRVPGRSDPAEDQGHVDPTRPPDRILRNTAVVDVEDLGFAEEDWDRVQEKSGLEPEDNGGLPSSAQAPVPRALQVGRVVARPGDTVTFNVPGGALGLAVNGIPLRQKPAASFRLVPANADPEQGAPARGRLYASAREATGERSYRVIVPHDPQPPRWPGMALPGDVGPVEMEAEGYLVIADNREEGACCDSRAVGWVSAEAIRGEVVLRLGRAEQAVADLKADGPGLEWYP